MSEKSKKNQTIQYYDQNAADFVENTRNVDFHVMQDEFIEGLPAGAKILDLGCGSGRDTKYFLEHGYRVDANHRAMSDRRLHGTVRVGIRVHGDSGEMPAVPRAGCIGSV